MKNKLRRSSGRLKPAADRITQAKGWAGDKRASSTARGYNYAWQQYRLDYLAEHPLCAIQGEGCEVAACIVDHIEPHEGDKNKFWNPLNHQPACKHCHDMHKQKQEAAQRYGSSQGVGGSKVRAIVDT